MVAEGLPAETGDNVGGDGAVRHDLPDFRNTAEIPFPGISAAHLLQHHIAAGLDREMDVAAYIAVLRHCENHLVAYILRMGSREPHPEIRAYGRHRSQQIGEVHIALRTFPKVGIHILSEQGHFLVTLREQVAGLPDNGLRITAALGSAGIGNHTVGADIVAAPHYGNEGRYPVPVNAYGLDVCVCLLAGKLHIDLGKAGTDGGEH